MNSSSCACMLGCNSSLKHHSSPHQESLTMTTTRLQVSLVHARSPWSPKSPPRMTSCGTRNNEPRVSKEVRTPLLQVIWLEYVGNIWTCVHTQESQLDWPHDCVETTCAHNQLHRCSCYIHPQTREVKSIWNDKGLCVWSWFASNPVNMEISRSSGGVNAPHQEFFFYKKNHDFSRILIWFLHGCCGET